MIYVNPTRLSMDSVWLFFGGESADFSALFLRSWKQPKNTRLTRGLGEFFFFKSRGINGLAGWWLTWLKLHAIFWNWQSFLTHKTCGKTCCDRVVSLVPAIYFIPTAMGSWWRTRWNRHEFTPAWDVFCSVLSEDFNKVSRQCLSLV